MADHIDLLQRLAGQRIKTRLAAFRERVNLQQGTTLQLIEYITNNDLPALEQIDPLREMANIIEPLDLGFTTRTELMLAVLQIIEVYQNDPQRSKRVISWKLYEAEREAYRKSFSAFNATWKDIRPKEKNGELIVEFPKANNISNGQRDILCLVALLEKAKRKLQKNNAIVIIDEVFDYLDQANLLVAQYYVTSSTGVSLRKTVTRFPLANSSVFAR